MSSYLGTKNSRAVPRSAPRRDKHGSGACACRRIKEVAAQVHPQGHLVLLARRGIALSPALSGSPGCLRNLKNSCLEYLKRRPYA